MSASNKLPLLDSGEFLHSKRYHTLCLCVCVCVCLSLSNTHTHTHAQSLLRPLSFPLTHTHSLCLFLTHTHTHTHCPSLCPSPCNADLLRKCCHGAEPRNAFARSENGRNVFLTETIFTPGVSPPSVLPSASPPRPPRLAAVCAFFSRSLMRRVRSCSISSDHRSRRL